MSEALIAARHADIYWNTEPENRHAGGAEVLVVDRGPNGVPRNRQNDPKEFWRSSGSMVGGWLTDGMPHHNPAGLFASVWLLRGSSPASVHAALREFAKIEECGWAREMLDMFDQHAAQD